VFVSRKPQDNEEDFPRKEDARLASTPVEAKEEEQ
jgi:hypothetical protein